MGLKRCKVLFIVTGFPSDSHPERSPFNYRAYLELAKHNEVEVVKLSAYHPRRRQQSVEQYKGFTYRVINLPVLTSISKSLNEHWLIRKIRSKIFKKSIEYNFDIIHAVGGKLPAQMAYEVSRVDRTPYIIQYIGSDVNFYLKSHCKDKYVAEAVTSSKSHVFNSNSLKSSFQRLFGQVEEADLRVVYRGVDLNQYTFCWQESPKLRFLYLGGITDGDYTIPKGDLKGGLTLLRAWHDMDSIIAGAAELIFAGPNSTKDQVKIKLNDMEDGLKNVKFLGPLKAEEVIVQMKRSHVVVIPSYAEGLPNVLLEAMATGNYIIATRVGGIPEVVKDENDGQLIKVGGVDDLIRALTQTILAKDRLKVYAKKTYETVQQFSSEGYGINYSRIYKEVIYD